MVMFRIQLFFLGCLILHTQAWQFEHGLEDNDDDDDLLRRTLLRVLERQAEDNEIPEEGGESGACQPLEDLLEEFATNHHWPTLIKLAVADYYKNVTTDEMWAFLKSYLGGHNLSKAQDRHTFSCLIYKTSTIEKLMKKFGLPDKFIEKYQEEVKEFRDQFGGLKSLEALSQMVYEFGTWAEATGYPTIPLKKTVSKEEMQEEMEQWLRLYNSVKMNDTVQAQFDEQLRKMMMPVHLNPEFAGRAFKQAGAKGTDWLLGAFCLDQRRYKMFKEHDLPQVLIAQAELAFSALKIVRHLIDRGFINI